MENLCLHVHVYSTNRVRDISDDLISGYSHSTEAATKVILDGLIACDEAMKW